MRKLTYLLNISIDGYADHQVALADDEMHEYAVDQMNSIDTVLFGRLTYQLFESFWPTAAADPRSTKSMIEYSDRINSIEKIVFSKTLDKADWNNTKLFKGDLIEEVKRLKTLPGKDISIGGLSVATSLMKAGLIDEFWFLVQPLIWGNGNHLFDGLQNRTMLKLVDTINFTSGVVVLHYVTTSISNAPL